MKRQPKNEERQHAEISAFHYLQPSFLCFSRGLVPATYEAVLVDWAVQRPSTGEGGQDEGNTQTRTGNLRPWHQLRTQKTHSKHIFHPKAHKLSFHSQGAALLWGNKPRSHNYGSGTDNIPFMLWATMQPFNAYPPRLDNVWKWITTLYTRN